MARSFSTFAHTLGRLAQSDRRCSVKAAPTSYIDVKVGKDHSRSFVLSVGGEQSTVEVPQGANPRDIADQLVAVLCQRAGVSEPSQLEMGEPKAAPVKLELKPAAAAKRASK